MDCAEPENNSLAEFKGAISDDLVERKISLLESRPDEAGTELASLYKRAAKIRYGKMTIHEIADKWDRADIDGRIDMLYRLPKVTEMITRAADARGISTRDMEEQLEGSPFGMLYDRPAEAGAMFEEYCKK